MRDIHRSPHPVIPAEAGISGDGVPCKPPEIPAFGLWPKFILSACLAGSRRAGMTMWG